MSETTPESPKCEVCDCIRLANGHYRWGDLPQQQANLCEICAIQLWSISPPHVKDRTICTPLREVAHA